MKLPLCLVILLGLGTAHAGAPEVTPWPPDRLERDWKRIEPVRERMGVRELFGFALEAAAATLHPDRVARALDLAEQMQDRDPKSRTYGNFKWYWNAAGPEDRNAVEFCMQKGILVWMHYRDRLNAKARERLERLIRFSVEGIRLHRVSELYTNIFLMKTWNCIAIGENTDRPDLAREGYEMFDRWLVTTWENGIHEYISPTYTGVDIDSLALLARFAKDARTRRHAELALRLFWTDIAANWYEPGQRLGGAHSRDYDYLTGHGYTDNHLRMLGWIPSDKPYVPSAFFQFCRWDPPAGIRRITERRPRRVQQRWSAAAGGTATHYVGRRFSLGSAGACYHVMDKPLTVNLPGGPSVPMVNFFMDARGDAYGKKRFLVGGGHSKALHLTPFLTSVQRGPEVLLLASAHPKDAVFQRYFKDAACLLSQVALPADVELWLGEKKATLAPGGRVDVPKGAAVFLRTEDVVVGIRVVLGLDTQGQPAPTEIVYDGQKYGAMRLTVTHSKEKPAGRGTVALWVRAEEGGDFAAFRKAMARPVETQVEGDHITVAVPGQQGQLRLEADVAAGTRIVTEGGGPGTAEALLAVDGRDYGRELLGKVDVIARYQAAFDAATSGIDGAAKAEQVVQAESAQAVLAPFRIEADATGGKFLWVPGEPGEGGGSPVARAVWLVHVPTAGEYRLWGRVQAPTPDDDSFFVCVQQSGRDALPQAAWHTGTHATWEWTQVTDEARKPVRIPLQPGVAVVEFRCREDGTKLDAFALTSRRDWKP